MLYQISLGPPSSLLSQGLVARAPCRCHLVCCSMALYQLSDYQHSQNLQREAYSSATVHCDRRMYQCGRYFLIQTFLYLYAAGISAVSRTFIMTSFVYHDFDGIGYQRLHCDHHSFHPSTFLQAPVIHRQNQIETFWCFTTRRLSGDFTLEVRLH